ncbi:MAG: GIY-YIG nuclease family protein [Candidatus Pacebacteria bacterium]|nr:GIY-YIG nuclease family protein [Candidatus Paceibacterota bacterium]
MPWTVYIIRCSDQTLYTGITNDLEKRVKQHNSGNGAKYTRGRTPVELIYHEELTDRSTASIREAEIKQLTRVQKLKLITNQT